MRLTKAEIALLPKNIRTQIERAMGDQPKPKEKRKRQPAQPSSLEIEFDRLVKLFGIEKPQEEVYFCDGRRWRLDRCWVLADRMVAVEIDGETNHARYHQITRDAIKRNKARELGWVVLVVTGTMLRENPVEFFEQLKQALGV